MLIKFQLKNQRKKVKHFYVKMLDKEIVDAVRYIYEQAINPDQNFKICELWN